MLPAPPGRKPLKEKLPCQTPGCDYPNWHICLVGKPDTFPQLLGEETRAKGRRRRMSARTDAHRMAMTEAQLQRWARIREENRPRDEKLVARYAEGFVSVKMLMEEFKLGRRVVLNVLKEAEGRGKITIRPPGHTLAKGAK